MRVIPESPPKRRGAIPADWLTLGAVLVVVLVVSLPRLHTLALHQNELDAIQATWMLGDSVLAKEPPTPLARAFESDRELEHRLEDVELLGAGDVLRRHGYLFDVSRTPEGRPVVRAWPWCCGETGYGAFVYTSEHGLLGHPNDDAHWSGPDHAPVYRPDDAGWRPVGDAGTR